MSKRLSAILLSFSLFFLAFFGNTSFATSTDISSSEKSDFVVEAAISTIDAELAEELAEKYPDDAILAELNEILSEENIDNLFEEEIELGIDPSQITTHVSFFDTNSNVSLSLNDYVEQLEDVSSAQADNVMRAFGGAVLYHSYLLTSETRFDHYVKITSFIGGTPTKIELTSNIYSATTRNGVYSKEGSAKATLRKVNDSVTAFMLPSTKYVKGDFSGLIYTGTTVGGTSSGTTPANLYNKKGVQYPEYRDPQSGIKLWEPPTNLVANPRQRSDDYREKFIDHYNKTYGAPKYFLWSDVQIHHMRPLKYNGSDSFDNLIPLWRPGPTPQNGILSHSVLNAWWTNY